METVQTAAVLQDQPLEEARREVLQGDEADLVACHYNGLQQAMKIVEKALEANVGFLIISRGTRIFDRGESICFRNTDQDPLLFFIKNNIYRKIFQ